MSPLFYYISSGLRIHKSDHTLSCNQMSMMAHCHEAVVRVPFTVPRHFEVAAYCKNTAN